MYENEYKSLSEILPHNNQLDSREMDMLIIMICKSPLTDKIRLDVINEAVYWYGGTVAMALVEAVFQKSI